MLNLASFGPDEHQLFIQARIEGLRDILGLSLDAFRERLHRGARRAQGGARRPTSRSRAGGTRRGRSRTSRGHSAPDGLRCARCRPSAIGWRFFLIALATALASSRSSCRCSSTRSGSRSSRVVRKPPAWTGFTETELRVVDGRDPRGPRRRPARLRCRGRRHGGAQRARAGAHARRADRLHGLLRAWRSSWSRPVAVAIIGAARAAASRDVAFRSGRAPSA